VGTGKEKRGKRKGVKDSYWDLKLELRWENMSQGERGERSRKFKIFGYKVITLNGWNSKHTNLRTRKRDDR